MLSKVLEKVEIGPGNVPAMNEATKDGARTMRLVCPNCSAQYEIDIGLIPDEGRDVQCSNCGNTWFELPPPLAEAAKEGVTGETPADAAEQSSEDEFIHEPEPEPTADAEPPQEDAWVEQEAEDWDWPETRPVTPTAEAPEPEDIPEPEDAPQETAVAEKAEAPEDPAPIRRPADVADLDVLREEAEHEISRRRSEAAPIETQPEFGLPAPEERQTPSRALRARMAKLRGEDDGEVEIDTGEDEYQAPRRDLLPDIEEINSSLRPTGDNRDEPVSPEVVEERQRGFRLGFVASVGLAALLVIAYAWAPAIASALPGTEQALIAYVDWANAARDALDSLMAGAAGGT